MANKDQTLKLQPNYWRGFFGDLLHTYNCRVVSVSRKSKHIKIIVSNRLRTKTRTIVAPVSASCYRSDKNLLRDARAVFQALSGKEGEGNE